MHFVDRYRALSALTLAGAGRGRGSLSSSNTIGCGVRAHFRREGQRIRLQRQMLALRADDIEFIAVAGRGMGNEQLPIAEAAHAHRMSPCIPEIEIADDADPLRIGREHDEGHPLDAIQHQRMRAELVVKPLMGSFAQKIQVEFRQHGRKAVGIVEIDDGLAEAGAQLVPFGAVREEAGEQPVIVDARQRRGLAMLVDRIHLRSVGQECADHGPAALGMGSEIAKGIGMATFQDRAGLVGKLGHEASFARWDKIRSSAGQRDPQPFGPLRPTRIRSRRIFFQAERNPAFVLRPGDPPATEAYLS